MRDLAELALPVLLAAGLTTFIALKLASVTLEKKSKLLPFAFAVLGGICGVIAGSSFETLVGGLITGMLGIVSAILSYIFTRPADSDTAAKQAIPLIVMLLLLNTLVGLSVGQNWKRKWENYAADLGEYRTQLNDLWVPANREYQTQILHRCLEQNRAYRDALANCKYTVLFPQE